MKPRVGILTSFTGADSAYSLINVTRTQINMLMAADYSPVMIVSERFVDGDPFWAGRRFRVVKSGLPEDDAEVLADKLRPVIADLDVILCHDIVFLTANKQYAEAVRKLAHEFEHIAWLHWQHSRGGHSPIAPLSNSWFCYPNKGDLPWVAEINSTDISHVRYIPHPLDFDYLGWPDLAIRIAHDMQITYCDVVMVYPARLDRQKQHDKLLRVFAGLKRGGKRVCLLIADAYATGEPFLSWKQELHALAKEQGLENGRDYVFLGEKYEECRVATPRQVVKALYEMSDIFIQPSTAETSSLVVLEAAMAGNLIILNADFRPIHHLYAHALALPFGSISEDTKYYRHVKLADGTEKRVEDPQAFWDDQARHTIIPMLESHLARDVKRQQLQERWPSRVFIGHMEPLILEAWEKVREKSTIPARIGEPVIIQDDRGDPEVTCIITTIDNLPMLQRQIPVVLDECRQVIVVNNGSLDGTADWLETLHDQSGVRWINRENLGAGPGRNAGLDMWANSTPYTLMLDGGILPPRGGVRAMKDYLARHPEVSLISPELVCYITDEKDVTYIMPETIPDNVCFAQTCISGTAYALVRASAWDAARFCEDGPFAQPGWGCDDNELMYHWTALGILHHNWTAALGMKLLRRTSGSFERLFRETGIWPNQYGSVYEQRNVLMFHKWRLLYDPVWHKYGAIEKSFIVSGMEYPGLARVCKRLHDDNREISHEVIVKTDGLNAESLTWLHAHALRWPWGDTTMNGSGIVKRTPENEDIWTGDIITDQAPRGKEIVGVNT